MAACGSLQHMFEKPLPENPTLIESLSPWNQIKKNPIPIDHHHQSSSFTEIFGELHFRENNSLNFQTPSSVFELDPKTSPLMDYSMDYNYGSHKNCTEGLGFESSDEVENSTFASWQGVGVEGGGEKRAMAVSGDVEMRRSFGGGGGGGERRAARGGGGGGGGFPPPIPGLSKSGTPRVCFRSYREDGRFVLKEIRVRRQEFLHACREDGRLKLHFVHPNYDDEIPEEEDFSDDVEGENDDDDDDDDDDVGDDGNNGLENNGYHDT